MLWSLLKIVFFIVAVTAITYGAMELSTVPGELMLTYGGLEMRLGPLEVLAALVALVVLVWVAFKLLGLIAAFIRFLAGDETAVTRYFARNRVERGYQALSDSMMALAGGEGHLAMTKAQKAERFLNKPEITTLLVAQAAEQTGDRTKAENAYKKLVEDDRTRFVGIRGLMRQRLEQGDTDTAMKLAEKAFALKPKHEDTQDVLLRLQAEKGDWKGARATLAAKAKTGSLPKDVLKRRDAVLALSEAKELLDDDVSIEKQEQVIAAHKQSPDLIHAAVLAARGYIAKGNKKHAARLLTKAWSASPHPDLATAFAEIEPNETPQERLKRFKSLTKVNIDDPETRMLMAELHIAAEEFPEARRALGTLPETDATVRVLTLMAAIERGSGGTDQLVNAWLAKAVTAPRGPQWICDNCQNIHDHWEPVCSNCHGFDTLSWRRPPQNDKPLSGGLEMLPLLVAVNGSAETAPVVVDADAEEAEVVEAETVDAEVVEER